MWFFWGFRALRIVKNSTLLKFLDEYPDAEEQLLAWRTEVRSAEWTKAADVKKKYGSASIITSERVAFNLCGNKYRIITRIKFKYGIVYIRFIGTHEEYDEKDAETV